MDENTKLNVIYDYLKQNKYMSLATADLNGKPEVATVEYVLDGNNILINTFIYYRKYKNLTDNPQVACVVTSGEDITLQFDAIVEELKDKHAANAKQKMLQKEPDFSNYFNDQKTRFFRISPTWMRLRDYTKKPTEVIEYTPG